MGDPLSFFILISIILLVVISTAISNFLKKIPNEIKEKSIYKATSMVLTLVFSIAPLAISAYGDRYTKVPFDKIEAKAILEQTWKPLMEFKDNIIIDKSTGIYLPPKYIKTKDDFIKAFTPIPEHLAGGLYDTLITETNIGTLQINQSSYVSSIFDKGAQITNCYIKKKKHEEELIIEEGGWIESIDMSYTRKNSYIKDKKGNWIYSGFTGSF